MPEVFPPLKNDRLIRAARKESVDCIPVWLMRQAGRYLPEFRAIRKQYDFFTVCRTPELAAEVTLQPLRRFDLDAAILFSDILVVPQAMGMEVLMEPGKGPVLPEPLRAPEDLNRLRTPEVKEELAYVLEAISLIRQLLAGRVPLIGFAGAPWTLMVYMVEGGSSKIHARVRSWIYRYPEATHQLLQHLSDVLVSFLKAQIEAGAQVLQLFDSWAGLLPPVAFKQVIWPYLQQISQQVKKAYPEVPLILFPRGAHYALPLLKASAYDVVGLDWTMEPQRSRQLVAGEKALQGNLDPAVLYASPDRIRTEAYRMIEGFGTRAYIANLGHGMHPDHPIASVEAFVEAVHQFPLG